MAKTIEKSARYRVRLAIRIAVLALLAVFFMFPYLFMLFRSFMPLADVMTAPVRFFPSSLSVYGYKMIFQNNYLLYTFNTLKIIVFCLFFTPLTACFVAYAFTKKKFVGSGVLFAVMLGTMMLPGSITQIPVYIIYTRLGMNNTHWPLMLGALFGGGAMNIFLFVQFMRGIPNEFLNAAKIDGMNSFQSLFVIIIPMCKPVIIFNLVGVFTGIWGDFQGPLIYLQSQEQYTLALGMYYQVFLGGYEFSGLNVKMAATTFMTIVPLILFFIFQKQLVQGVAIGGIKG